MSSILFPKANTIETLVHSNIDDFYGPYISEEEAKEYIPSDYRAVGLTVGIYTDDTKSKIKEKWFLKEYIEEGDFEDNQGRFKWILEDKIEEYKLNIKNISHISNTNTNEITFIIRVEGKGFGVLTNIYLGSNKVGSVSTLLNLDLTITIKAPENPGNYTYNIAAIDTILGNGTSEDYQVTWKEVDIKILSSSSLYSYKVKSLSNLINSSFNFLIYKVDSITINKVSIIYGNKLHILYNIGDTYSDNYLVNFSDLEELESGNLVLIKVEGNMTSGQFTKEVVLLTAPGIFSACQGTIPESAFNGLSFSANFYFEAENEANYQVVIKDNNKIVYNSSLLSYSTNILTLKLIDNTLSENNLTSKHTLLVFIGDSEQPNYIYKELTLKYVSNLEKLEDLDSATHYKNTINFNLQELLRLELLSYILDLVCYIPYTTDLSNLFSFGNITINRDGINFRSIKYPIPMQKTVSIGFMCNVKSSYLNLDFYYDALFIDGVLIKKYPHPNGSSPSGVIITSESDLHLIDKISSKIRLYYNTEGAITESPEDFVLERNFKARNPEEADSSNLPLFKITPLNNIKTKADLTLEQINQISDGKLTIDNIEYFIINTNKYRIGNFGNLGDIKYIENDIIRDFCTSYDIPNQQLPGETISEKNTRILNTLKKKVKTDPSGIPNNYLTLTRQIVASKSLLLKYVAVPCRWEYWDGLSGYLLAFTQGTSTLEYALPNFTFKFYTDNTFSDTTEVSIIPKIHRTLLNLLTYSNEIDSNDSNTEYYKEKELVAKADYMESSHLNNTPTAMFYNAITTLTNGFKAIDFNGNIVKDNEDQDVIIFKNPVEGKLNAIEGIPIILTINEINYGSFMLNIGKTGSSIGFGTNGISLEGTSNDDNSGLSSRFSFGTEDTEARQYLEGIANNIDSITEVNNKFVNFLAGGLEYRYSNAGADDIGDDLGEYKRILKMWNWVYTHDTYSKSEFEEMFNFEFAALYYIQMLCFGQTDNLGKNMMIDQFTENGQWYIRPYDMDSLGGLNNNGDDFLTPIIEISKDFVLDLKTKNIGTVQYLGDETPRFPYSSKTSNLWIRFFRNLRSDVENYYVYLRKNGYSAESIISLCKKEVIDKLKIKQYNIDFQNKYLSNTKQQEQFALGNRWFKFLDWMQKRFDFCDTYFGYNKYKANTSGSTGDYTILYLFPLYTLYEYNDAGVPVLSTNWGTLCDFHFEGTTKQDMQFSPKYIIDDDNIFNNGFSSIVPRVKLNNLTKYSGRWSTICDVIDLSENTYLLSATIRDINTISDNGYIPNSIEQLTISNSSLIPNLDNFTNLETVTFAGCEGNIKLNNCPNLKTININSGKRINLELVNCGNEDSHVNIINNNTIFNLITFNGCYIDYLNLQELKLNLSFTGETTYVNIVNLFGASILNLELDITRLETKNLILNSISAVKIKTSVPKSFDILGLDGSSIILWGNITETFDGSMISNINTNLRMTNAHKDTSNMNVNYIDNVISSIRSGSYISTIRFRLYNCRLLWNVKNLNIDIGENGTYLFAGCSNLRSVKDSIITASGQYMFDGCYNLTTLPTKNGVSTINLSDNNATRMFCSCHKLAYSEIEKVLSHNATNRICKVTNYSYFMYNKSHESNIEIDLLLYGSATTLERAFCVHGFTTDFPTTNKNITNNITITVKGKLPNSLVNVSGAFIGFNGNLGKHVYEIPYDIFSNCSNLINVDFCFAKNCPVTGYFTAPILPNNNGITFNRTFSLSKVNILHLKVGGILKIPSKTKQCWSMFNYAELSDSPTLQSSPIEVSQSLSGCNILEEAMNCFRGCKNITCNEMLTLTSSKYVNIAGILAELSSTVKYGFNGNWYSRPDVNNYLIWDSSINTRSTTHLVGPYYGTKISIASLDITISNLNYQMRNVLDGAIIDNSEQSVQIILNVSTKNCTQLCRNLKLANASDINSTLEINLTNVEYASEAFRNVGFLKTDESIEIPHTLINGSYMFAGSNITKLPELYECSNLTNTVGMFQNCRSLEDTLPITHFTLPISVTNINYMFDGCYGLYGGIPEDFIEIVNKGTSLERRTSIKELIRVFSSTAILLIGGNSDDIVPLDISAMFPLVTNVTGLFYWLCTNNGNRQNKLLLSSNCFQYCQICDSLFNSALVTIPIGCNFESARSMRFAFANAYTYNGNEYIRNILNIQIGGDITDITGIFAALNDSKNPEIDTNKDTLLGFKDIIAGITYSGMLFGYSNSIDLMEYANVSAPSATPILTVRHS